MLYGKIQKIYNYDLECDQKIFQINRNFRKNATFSPIFKFVSEYTLPHQKRL